MKSVKPVSRISRCLAPVALITFSMCVHSKAQKGRDGFENWAKSQASPIKSVEFESDLSDLRPLKAMIGTARVVALGEPTHGAHEPLALRNKIFRYLVEELGFTTIALEGGLPESRLIHESVAGGSASLEQVLRDGFSCGIGEWKESEELVRWMRAYNSNPEHTRKIAYYSIDVGRCGQGTPLAYEKALTYLARVDPDSAKRLRAVIQPFWDRVEGGDAKPLSAAESDGLSAAIEDLLALLERERISFLAASSEADYLWAHRNAIAARQAHRQYRVRPTPSSGGGIPPSAWRPSNQRDASMADNLRWVMEREGPKSRILVFAHNAHLKNAPTEGGMWSVLERPGTVMGQHLRSMLGSDLVILGTCSQKNGEGLPPASAEPGSLDAALARVGPPQFLLDLRAARANAGAAAWLAERRPVRMNSTFMLMPPSVAFDALVYIDALTPARSLTPPR